MLIYDALKKDHVKVKALLDELVALKDNAHIRKRKLITQIRNELIPHARAEEAVLYNSLRDIASAEDVVLQAYDEHIEAETALHTLQIKDIVDLEWKETAVKLRDSLLQHVDEEENYIFGVAQQLFTREEAEVMGEAFENLKPQIREEGLLQTSVDMLINIMPPRIAAGLRTFNISPRV